MAYQSLYRKYRPQTFEDIVGQVPVVRTLVNAITEDRLHHAYLFAGPRGTGKTSTARILAKAINCAQGPTPTPCDVCDMCVNITNGSAVDVVELDMASHGSVDDARELRERALFAPAQARRKVYILDEVHMASTQAFNALLKLIEEPPAHVLFTMATTDPQKVLTTILSRVQRLDLRRVGAADVGAHIRRIAEAEGRQLDDDAVDGVVRAGDGSVRDTMSILEQVLAYGSGTITGEQVGEVLGTTPADVTFRAAQHVIDRDVAGVLTLVQDLMDDGKDLRRFALDLIGHLRDLLVLQVAPERPDLLDTTEQRREQVAEQAPLITRETLIRTLTLLADALTEMRQGPPRLPLELALSRAALPEVAGDVGALADRVSRLETGAPAPVSPKAAAAAVAATTAAVATPPATAPTAPPVVEPEPELTAAAATPAAAAPDPEPEAASPDPVAADPIEAAPPAPAAAPEPVDVEHAVAEISAPEPAAAAPGRPAPATPAVSAPVDAEPAEAPAASPAGDDLFGSLTRGWPSILERVRESSRRAEAIFGVARPLSLANGQLTLGFAQQHANFHAKQAPNGDLATTMLDAVEQVTGHRPAGIVATITDDLEVPTLAIDASGAAPSAAAPAAVEEAAEELAVAEAEAEAAAQPEAEDDTEAVQRAEDLLLRELEAEPVD